MAFISGKNAKLLVKEFDLSTFFQEVTAGSTADELDVTAFGSAYRSFIGGMAEGSMSMTGFFDPAVGASDTVLNESLDDAAPFPVSFCPGGHAVVGDPAFLLKAVESRYETGASIGAAVPAAAAMVGSGGSRWGRVLATGLSVAAPGVTPVNLAEQDNPQQAATTKGASAHLHILSNSLAGGTFSVIVQHDDVTGMATPATLMSFTTIAAGIRSSERKEVAVGTNIDRFVRVNYVASAALTGAISFVVTFSRGF